jgi:hypothetical protein
VFKSKKKYATTVVDLCDPRRHTPPHFTFIPVGKLVSNYARSYLVKQGKRMKPSQDFVPSCTFLVKKL